MINNLKIISLLTLVTIVMLIIGIYVTVHNTLLLADIDIIYTSDDGIFIYLLNGNMEKERCGNPIDCSYHLTEIMNKQPDGDIQYTAIYNITKQYDRYSRTSLLVSTAVHALSLIFIIIIFLSAKNLKQDIIKKNTELLIS